MSRLPTWDWAEQKHAQWLENLEISFKLLSGDKLDEEERDSLIREVIRYTRQEFSKD